MENNYEGESPEEFLDLEETIEIIEIKPEDV